MKSLIITIAFLTLSCTNIIAQDKTVAYNKALADSLGADEYGMKMYYMVILKTGDKKIADKEKEKAIFKGHLDNIGKLANEGKLIIAGPFGKNEHGYRGIFILSVKTKEEVIALLQTDPVIKEGVMVPEIFEWYGSAALPKYLEYHDMIQKTKF